MAAALLVACQSGEDDPEYWVEDGDPIILRGQPDKGNPDILTVAGELGYDAASQCLFIKQGATRYAVIWHMEVTPSHESGRAGVEIHSDANTGGTLYEGDLVAGYTAEVSSQPGLPTDCHLEGTIPVFNVSALPQDELRDLYSPPES